MLKARSRKISLVLVLAMLMTMFAGLGTASAATPDTPYREVTVPTFGTVESTGNELGIIEIKLDTAIGIKAGDILTISYPSSVTIGDAVAEVVYDVNSAATASDVVVEIPQYLPGTNNVANALNPGIVTARVGATKQSVDIIFTANGTSGTALMYVYTRDATVSASEDLVATIMGSNSGVFPMGTVLIGKIVSGTGTNVSAKSVKTIGNSRENLDIITLIETKTGTLKAGDVIKFKLPNGFGWAQYKTDSGLVDPIVSTNWAFSSQAAKFNPQISSSDSRLLTVTLANDFTPSTSATGAGRFDLAAGIVVTDDSIAKFGDVTMNVSGTNVTDQDIVVANYGDYGVTIEEGTIQEVIAGWDTDFDKASFRIKENLAGSLLTGRTISLTLPDGAKWLTNAAGNTNWPNDSTRTTRPVTVENIKGTVAIQNSDGVSSTNNGRTLKLTVTGGTKSTLEFKKFQIALRADFSGDLNIEIGGNAGVEGTVKIAEVFPAITLENDGKAKIAIGTQAQPVGDLIIKESVKEAIDVINASNKNMVLQLPDGATWTVKPTVEVTEGDLTIDSVRTDGRLLYITFKSSSTKPSTIKISNIKVTANRTVPEGDFKISVLGSSGSVSSDVLTNNSEVTKFNVSTIASAVVGQVVTPAPGAGAGEFKIGSNIYYVNGIAKVMDVAPYIKNDRTYVPMRYLGEMLGAEVVWDDAARTVTLTKADTTVVFTIGSTSYTVNGEAKTADVAPEITNDRTMLPARFVAEAFGAIVGWDPATQTVLIQQQ